VTLSKQTALLASGNRSSIRFSVLTETNGDTGSVRTDKANAGPGKFSNLLPPVTLGKKLLWLTYIYVLLAKLLLKV